MRVGKFFQPLPLRRSRGVRGEGVYLRVDEGSTGSRRDTQNVRFREEALMTADDIADGVDDDIGEAACQLRGQSVNYIQLLIYVHRSRNTARSLTSQNHQKYNATQILYTHSWVTGKIRMATWMETMPRGWVRINLNKKDETRP